MESVVYRPVTRDEEAIPYGPGGQVVHTEFGGSQLEGGCRGSTMLEAVVEFGIGSGVGGRRGCLLAAGLASRGWGHWQCELEGGVRRCCDASDFDLVSPMVDVLVGDMPGRKAWRLLTGPTR